MGDERRPDVPEPRTAEPDVEDLPHPLQDSKEGLISYDVSWQSLGLPEPVVRQLNAHKCPHPSVTQVKMISETLKPHRPSGIIEAPTGTGKTIGFIATILAKLDYDLKKTQAVILTPTKILAEQIAKECNRIAKDLGVTITMCVGQDSGFEFVPDSQIAVGTAASFLNNYKARTRRAGGGGGKTITVPARCSPDFIHTVVLDECDELFGSNSRNSVDTFFSIVHSDCQRILCSATIGPGVEKAMAKAWLSADQQNFSLKLELRIDRTVQLYLDCSRPTEGQDLRLKAFMELLDIGIYGKGFQGIVFCETRHEVDELYNCVVQAGFTASRYHSEMPLEDKDRQFDDFKKHRTTILITTNVLARGIDIVSISMVVNYCPPKERTDGSRQSSAFRDTPGEGHAQKMFIASPSTYVHRIGRGGRFGRPNVAITFCSTPEELENLAIINKSISATYASQVGTLEQRLTNEAVTDASVIHRVPIDDLTATIKNYFEDKQAETEIEDEILKNDRALLGNLRRNPELIAKIAQLREEKRRKREERSSAPRPGRKGHARPEVPPTVTLQQTDEAAAGHPTTVSFPSTGHKETEELPADFHFGYPQGQTAPASSTSAQPESGSKAQPGPQLVD